MRMPVNRPPSDVQEIPTARFGFKFAIRTYEGCIKPEPLDLPMRRDLAQPLNAGVLVLRVPAEAPRPGLLYPFGCVIHGLRLPSEPESPAARAHRWARPG